MNESLIGLFFAILFWWLLFSIVIFLYLCIFNMMIILWFENKKNNINYDTRTVMVSSTWSNFGQYVSDWFNAERIELWRQKWILWIDMKGTKYATVFAVYVRKHTIKHYYYCSLLFPFMFVGFIKHIKNSRRCVQSREQSYWAIIWLCSKYAAHIYRRNKIRKKRYLRKHWLLLLLFIIIIRCS